MDFGEDGFGVFGPHEWGGVVVPVGDPGGDGVDELADGVEPAASQPAVGEFLEPPLDEVEPRGAGGGEV